MDAFENVFVGEALLLHFHENGDCQEPDDRHSERSRVGSELLLAVPQELLAEHALHELPVVNQQ